jgi:hypothetical protein
LRSAFNKEIQVRCCLFLAALLFIAATSAGCSSSGTAAVEGKVTFGGEPIDVGTITFLPESEAGAKTGGLIDKGAYRVDPKVGPSPGPHRVEIRWAKPTGKKSKNEFGEEIERRQEGLPEKYHAQSTLTADIKPGKNAIDFQLEK